MKNKFFAFMLCAALAFTPSVGCGEKSQAEKQTSSAVSETDTCFDIETARKNISVNGQNIELPMKLSELGEGWDFEIVDTDKEGFACVIIKYKGDEIFSGTLAECETGNEENSILYNLSVNSDKCSVDGFTPDVSVKDDILKKYGEPVDSESYEKQNCELWNYGDIKRFKFGTYILKSRGIVFNIDADGIVKSISITYWNYD